MSYTNLLYHIVYATKSRAPLITSDLKSRLHGYLGGIVSGLGSVPIEINGMEEHVHLLVRLRPTIAVSDFLSKLSASSAGTVSRSMQASFEAHVRREARLRLTWGYRRVRFYASVYSSPAAIRRFASSIKRLFCSYESSGGVLVSVLCRGGY